MAVQLQTKGKGPKRNPIQPLGTGGYDNEWPAGFLQVPTLNLGEGGLLRESVLDSAQLDLDSIIGPPPPEPTKGWPARSQSLSTKAAPTQEASLPALTIQSIGVKGKKIPLNGAIPNLWRAYKSNEMVFAAVDIKASSAQAPRIMVQKRTKDGDWEEIQGHPLRMLMMRPNSYMDEAAFNRSVFTTQDVTGLFYAEIVRRPGSVLPAALYPLDPAKLTQISRGDDSGMVDYQYKEGNNPPVIIPGENMLVKRIYDPQDRLKGLSRLAVCLGSVDADTAQTDYIREFFNNGGVPSGIIKIKGKRLTEAQGQELQAKWSKRYGRGTGRQHAPAVLDEDADYTKVGANLDELESQSIRSFTESRICMVFGVPPLIIYSYTGLLRATYSNLKEAWENFWTGTLYQAYADYKSWLTWNLLTQFENEESIRQEQIRLEWDFSKVEWLQESQDAKEERATKRLAAGGITVNEYRAEIGQAPDPAGDYYLRPSQTVAVPFGMDPGAMDLGQALSGSGDGSQGQLSEGKILIKASSFPHLLMLEQGLKAAATKQSLMHQIQLLSQAHIQGDWRAIEDQVRALE